MSPPADEPSRSGGREVDSLRPVSIDLDPLKFADGSALITCGDTRVLVAATLEGRVPPFLTGSGSGWLTAEYAMLPRATPVRSRREVTRGRPSGRSSEIQRLVGRSLRAALDLPALGERTLILDCDVIQADGGTRTASITGAWVAAVRALARALLAGDIERWPVTEQIAAVSVGVVGGVPMLDLDAPEDQSADVDMNVVATAAGRFVEIQGTAERQLFTRQDNDALLDLAMGGIKALCRVQNETLAETLAEVAAVSGRRRRKVPPKDEASVWRRPGSS
jgi:ribonuclease PH